MNCGTIITIDIVEINTIETSIMQNANHLGILKIVLILPVIVQRAIAKIIDAKNRISISFKLHKINMEMIKIDADKKLVVFKLNF